MNNTLCTIGSSISRKSWWKWALFGLLALYSLLLVSRCSPIEQDLHARATEALNEKGFGWAKPTLEKRGRDLMLSGEAPSEAARDLAINTVANVYGVRVVDHDITLKQYSTPVFGLNNDDGKTILTGSFPKQALIDQVLRTASDNFGADNVVNKMTVSEDVSSPVWLAATLGVLPAIVTMTDADLDINNEGASLNGTFHTNEEKKSFLGLIDTAFGNKFTDNSIIKPLGPTPEELAEIARLAEEAEATRLLEEAKISEEKRIAEEAEAQRLIDKAEEARVAEEAEMDRLAEEKRLAEAAEATRLANEKSMAAIMLAAQKAKQAKAEAARIAEEARVAEEAEAARLAEEKRLAEEAEATRLANEKSMAAIIRIRRCENHIQVSGHTDSRGSADMNMKLSQDRAKAVHNYLIKQGTGSSVITSQGYGETKPVADNSSAVGRKLNRRIQFTILK